ncbi:MAG: cytochrome d ubiquinol oxidase subunit II [Paracoccus sp. (in: a-proteobacteria)]|nr:cytochrome d ubiquinol oxidase subunit II [Paracoccus sp. (in: a-proteobacteria)]
MILHELLSFEILRLIWWVLIGVLLIGFAVSDGFDMGVGALLPFVADRDAEREAVVHTIAPIWEGNQVWFILGGGAIFAAWPALYALSFSGFYLAMFTILAALILRPVAIKYRGQRPGTAWREGWDWALFIGSVVPAALFGLAVGNVLQGVPFHLTPDLLPVYEGGIWAKFFGLLNPFAILCGAVSLAMLVLHGAGWLVVRTTGDIQTRARRFGFWAGVIAIAGYAAGGLWLTQMQGFAFAVAPPHDGPSNPLLTQVVRSESWMLAYAERPWILVAPVLGFAGLIGATAAIITRRELLPISLSKLGIMGVISSVGLVMFPFIMPSSTHPDSSLTVWDSSSTHFTLFVMLVASVIFLPIILAYTAWVYSVIWGKVKPGDKESY